MNARQLTRFRKALVLAMGISVSLCINVFSAYGMEEVRVVAPYVSNQGSDWMHYTQYSGDNWVVGLDGVDSVQENMIMMRYCQRQQADAEAACESSFEALSDNANRACRVVAGTAVLWGSRWLSATPAGIAVMSARMSMPFEFVTRLPV